MKNEGVLFCNTTALLPDPCLRGWMKCSHGQSGKQYKHIPQLQVSLGEVRKNSSNVKVAVNDESIRMIRCFGD